MTLLSLILLSLLIFPYFVRAHGVKGRINQHGIDFAAEYARELLDKEIRGQPIPYYPIDTKFGFKVEIKNAKIEDFSLPKLQPLLQEGGMLLTSSGGFVKGSLRYCMKKKILIFNSAKCGNVQVDVSDIQIQMRLHWRPNSIIPAVEVTSCDVHIENYRITGNSLTNLLHEVLGDYAKRSIEKSICPLLVKLIDKNINPKIAGLPSIFEVGGRKNFDLEFFNVAPFLGNYFMEVSADASINFLELASIPLKFGAVRIIQPYLDNMGEVQPILGHKIADNSVITAVDGYLRLDINFAKA